MLQILPKKLVSFKNVQNHSRQMMYISNIFSFVELIKDRLKDELGVVVTSAGVGDKVFKR